MEWVEVTDKEIEVPGDEGGVIDCKLGVMEDSEDVVVEAGGTWTSERCLDDEDDLLEGWPFTGDDSGVANTRLVFVTVVFVMVVSITRAGS